MRRVDGTAGSATVWLLGLALLPLSATTAAAGIAEARAVRHRAEAAADLAALAGAGPGGGSCDLAGRVAAADGARILACTVTWPAVTVRVAVTVTLPLLGPRDAVAHARAGPAAPAPVPPPAGPAVPVPVTSDPPRPLR